MARKVGLTAAVLDVLSDGQWHTCSGVANAVPREFRATASVILSQFYKAGRAERRGEYRAYEYRLLPVDARKRAPLSPSMTAAGKKADSAATSERGAAPAARNASASRPAAVATIAPARGEAFAASLGTVVFDKAAPANPASGRIEDAIAAALDRHDARMLDQVFALVPNGWSRLDVVSGIADGVIAGWIRARRAGARDAYLLVRDPPPVLPNPQVERFKAHRLLEQCRMLDADTTDALAAAREYDAPAELVRALVDLRRAAARTLQQLEA